MDFKTELLENLERIKKSYEDGSKLGEYAKGRYANTKMIIDIVKKMNYTHCCTELSENNDDNLNKQVEELRQELVKKGLI